MNSEANAADGLKSTSIYAPLVETMSGYQPAVSEPLWQQAWSDAGILDAEIREGKPKFYCLEMYPYPSGKMHMGHVRNYSIGDAMARFKRLMGYDVLYPIGFDSFGMPAENAAIAEGGHPHEITERNMASITEQIKRMGFSYDWRRMVKSHDPNYYRWNQLFFLKFLERGIAFQHFAPVNWCEDCTTVLANEQVKAGRCWRCNGPVSQKEMSQWFLDIPQYAQELLDGLEEIDFPENVKALQQDWLGRSEGAEIEFGIEGSEECIRVFTTRPDTLFGSTFVTLAPEHPLAEKLVKGTEHESNWKELYDEVALMSEFDRIKNMNAKKGIPLGVNAIHPLTGDLLPIWAGNFVIASYGTGAVMAVPGHDERDFEFAKEYDIPIKRVLTMEENGQPDEPLENAEVDLGWMVNSPFPGFDGLYGEHAKSAVCEALENAGKGNRTVNWKIRPWLISRQRYWGTPIPIIHCSDCGAVPVPEDQLPVELPNDVAFTGTGNPLKTSSSFLNVDCPKCSKPAKRECDTMDTFVDSSWYFLRYTDAMNLSECFDKEIANHWMNVDFYCGGIEHAQMHLIYARFWTKALRDVGLHSVNEPFQALLCQGMVNKAAPWCEKCAVTLNVSHQNSPCPHCGNELSLRSAKMSKSLGNTVSPEEMIERFGADTVRLFILFAANPTAGMDWSDTAIEANHRQVKHLYTIPSELLSWNGKPSVMDDWLRARFAQRVSEWQESMDSHDLRRAVEISHYDLIKDVNWYQRRGGSNPQLGNELLLDWAKIISIATPHLAEDWWEIIGESGLVAEQEFPILPDITETGRVLLDEEEYLRDVLENARKIKNIAERHLDGPANSAIFVTTPNWKNDLAKSAINYINEGGKPKGFVTTMADMEICQGERKGEIMGFWGKRMLPQIFKWSDEEKRWITSDLDEVSALEKRCEFIAQELGLTSVSVVEGESSEDSTGKSGSSMPLSPAVVFS